MSAYHYCTGLQQLCLCITSAEPVVTNLWTVRWTEMTSSLTCSSEGGVWTISLHLCTWHAQSSSLFTSNLPVVKITSLFQSLGTVYFIWFCIQRFTAFEPYCVTDLLSLKEWQADITRRTAQTLYCFNSCYTVKRTKMFLLCQVPRW